MNTADILWPKDVDHAMRIQNELRRRVRLDNAFDPIELIGGIDVSYDLNTNRTHAFIVVLDYATLRPIASVTAHLPTAFPYIPGFLSFREIPSILEAIKKLKYMPQLFMVDGQGIAHPRRLGIAAHLGALIDKPTIGVAKSRLIGRFDMPGPLKGNMSLLIDKTDCIGTVLRSRDRVKPLFISAGHRVTHDMALAITQQCVTRFRLPEPTRLADKMSKNSAVKNSSILQPTEEKILAYT